MDKQVVKTTPCPWCDGVMEMHYKWSRPTAFLVALLGIGLGLLLIYGEDIMGGILGIICIVISPMIAAQGRYPRWRCTTCGKKFYGHKPSRLTIKRVLLYLLCLLPILWIIAALMFALLSGEYIIAP